MKIKSVLYITTQLTGTWRYFSWCAYPNIWYSRLQREVISHLEKKLSFDFFVKFYPNDLLINPNVHYLKKKYPKSILEGSLTNILKSTHFDLIITEAIATTLLEILCTKSQIILFSPDDFVKMEKDGMKILENRAFISHTKEEYLGLIKELTDENSTTPSKEINDDFLFKYGIGSPNQSPFSLAVSSIENILKESLDS